MSTTAGGHEKREFQAETRQLLDLMIHSIYSNPDTFLREVVSNGSDALDKLRLAALTEELPGVDTSDLHLELIPDAGGADSARRLTITDNGIGMSRDEVVDLIGTLAKSGTAAMREQLAAARAAANAAEGEISEQATADLIGQFGIGFYSTFMVADTVTLVTRKAGEQETTLWRSAGEDTYDIATATPADAAAEFAKLGYAGPVPEQGTVIVLDLKPAGGDTELPDYTDSSTLRRVVRTYSDFIAWPIRMPVPAKAKDEGAEDAEADAESDVTGVEDAPGEETLNSQKALWTRPQAEVSEEEYTEFYRHVSHAWDEPAETMTIRAEGSFEYQALLFIPSQPPFDLFSPDHRRGVQLYVRRVFIMDDAEALIPQYLRFVKGVVDAADLSLNVSREILQQDRQIAAIRKRIVRKTLQTINAMRENEPEKFAEFWQHFGSVVKEGLIDGDGRDQILKFAEFESTRAGEKSGDAEGPSRTTAAEYISRMVEGQTEVYYITGASRAAVENSPHLEAFRARGVDVLLLTDPVDEVWVDAVGDFEGKPLRSIAKGDVDLAKVGTAPQGESEAEEKKEDADYADLLSWLGESLSDQVKEVRLSHRLVDSPACMVGDTFDLSPQLERMYRANGIDVPTSKRILELNPKHPAVEKLRSEFAATSDSDTTAREALANTAEVLAGIAVLAEGGELSDPAAFAKLLAGRL
ncbi:molecular chaperone HtpG [Dietzia sp.]|uniref:molecular chaperone HtpG n=1 Tax=Dietzia sp. TaxID=1871616 RepID=UPI002FDA0019